MTDPRLPALGLVVLGAVLAVVSATTSVELVTGASAAPMLAFGRLIEGLLTALVAGAGVGVGLLVCGAGGVLYAKQRGVRT